MEITAAVLRAADAPYTTEHLSLADPGPDEVLVRIVATGMCHSDTLLRSPGLLMAPPIIPGHEGAGVVEAIGSDVTGVEVGDHVVLSYASCGTCGSCLAGRPFHCASAPLLNITGRNLDWTTGVTAPNGEAVSSRWFGQSSFATHAIATQRNVVVVDRDLPLELLGPLGCGFLTGAGSILNSLEVEAGSSVAVFGAGAVGLAAIMAAAVAEAATIIAVDLHPSRLELALELGATHTVDGAANDVAQQIQKLTGDGADYTVDATGVPAVVAGALASTRMGGTCALVGILTADVALSPFALSGRSLVGVLEGDAVPQQFIPRLIELWRAGRFPFDRLIEFFPLDAINDAEQASLSGRVVKPVLRP